MYSSLVFIRFPLVYFLLSLLVLLSKLAYDPSVQLQNRR
jgi:hypothetical protein